MKYINMFECQIQGLEENIKLCDTFYPGWQVPYSQSNGRKAETKLTKQIFQLRVYHDLAPTDPLMENLCRFNTPFLILPRFHHFWKSFLARSHFYSKVSFTSIDCRLSCKYRSLDLCDVRNLPSNQVRPSIPRNQVLSRIHHLGCSVNIVHLNQSIFSRGFTQFRTIAFQIGDPVKLFPMLWRFFPTLDPQVPISHILWFNELKEISQVEIFVSRSPGSIFRVKENLPKAVISENCFFFRDLDSLPTRREVAAVEEWLQSGKTLHAMRDNPYHWQEHFYL